MKQMELPLSLLGRRAHALSGGQQKTGMYCPLHVCFAQIPDF